MIFQGWRPASDSGHDTCVGVAWPRARTTSRVPTSMRLQAVRVVGFLLYATLNSNVWHITSHHTVSRNKNTCLRLFYVCKTPTKLTLVHATTTILGPSPLSDLFSNSPPHFNNKLIRALAIAVLEKSSYLIFINIC